MKEKKKKTVSIQTRRKNCGRKRYCIRDYITTQDECERVDQGYRDG